jgi:hypothetical protein
MKDATFRRNAAAIGLAAAALLSAVSVLLQPSFGSDPASRLAAIDAAGLRGQVSAVTFLLAQLPAIAGLLGVAHLVRRGSPRLSNAGGALAVVGAFGHTVFGGMSMVYLGMAADADHRAAYGSLIGRLENSPVMIFSLLGLVGFVLGIALLAVGLWRTQVGARWVPPLLGVWLVAEFVGSGISAYAAPLSATLFVVACFALARTIWQTPAHAWSTPDGRSTVPEPAPAPL